MKNRNEEDKRLANFRKARADEELPPYRATSRNQSRKTIFLAAIVMLLFLTSLVLRLFETQIINYNSNARRAAGLQYKNDVNYPERGEIIDRMGNKLAVTTYVYTIGITPKNFRAANSEKMPQSLLCETVAELLDIPIETVSEAVEQTDKQYVQLKKNVSRADYDRLQEFLRGYNVGGLAADIEMLRYYTQPDLAPQVIGFTYKEDRNIAGANGLENMYNKELSGTPGFSYGQVDHFSNSQLYFSEGVSQSQSTGYNLVLHLDSYVQSVLETELESMIEPLNFQGGGVGIVMDVKTGGVLAMAQTGSFDPNDPYGLPQGLSAEEVEDWHPLTDQDQQDLLTSKVWLNRAISEPYEPGSTYKAFTVAMALEEQAVSETETFSDEPIHVKGWDAYPIKCSAYPANHGYETMKEGLWYSCNPVMVQIAQRIGRGAFYDYVQAFGHLELTGIDLPGEQLGLNHENPSDVDLAVWSFGEQATVTPIQLLNTFAAIGNGGLLMEPQVADYFTDENGNVVRDIQPKVLRRILSKETSEKTIEYMRGVVTDGTAPVAEVPGYNPAGKTSRSTHGENDEFSVVSFASVAPAENPQIAVLIVMYLPQPSTTSWPAQYVNGRVTEKTLEYLKVPRKYTQEMAMDVFNGKLVPKLAGQNRYAATVNAGYANFDLFYNSNVDFDPGSSATIQYQYPDSGQKINGKGLLYMSTDPQQQPDQVTVPDFYGMDMDEALKLAEQSSLNVRFVGSGPSGTVQSQSADPESEIMRYSVIELTFADN